MKSTTKGFIILVILACLLIVTWYFLAPLMEERRLDRTSDAGKIENQITIAGDSWLGYFIFRSPEFKKQMRNNGINPIWVDDNANYQERMQKLARGEYNFIVATVDSYILNAHNVEPPFPGVIISVIDESKGGDAIVAKSSIQDINGLNSAQIKIALTPSSPSEFLLKAVASHFNVNALVSSTAWKVETNGAKKAYEALTKGQVEAAIVWEPYVSKTLKLPDYHKLLGTEKTKGLIVDILIAHRETIDKSPRVVTQMLQAYFRALHHYQNDTVELEKQAAQDTNEKKAVARKMLEGITFINFNDNCRAWFGLSSGGGNIQEQLVMAIESTVSILVDNDDLNKDPLQGNPYTLINSALLESLYSSGSMSVSSKFTVPAPEDASRQKIDFDNLDDARWNRLKTVGKLKIRPIVFQSSTPILSMTGKEEVDRAADVITHYPQFRILIKGHTSPSGDEEANKKLSQDRADSVRKYLVSVHDIDQDRIKAIGLGSKEPLPRPEKESFRAYKLRLQRVEFLFLEENI